jgi:hypothetical protein
MIIFQYYFCFYLGSRLTSPRPSIIGKSSRKRALSHSPISDYLDIQSLTRSSAGSLHLPPYMHQSNSRSSSASGSYGHLSAGKFATSFYNSSRFCNIPAIESVKLFLKSNKLNSNFIWMVIGWCLAKLFYVDLKSKMAANARLSF